MTDTTPAAPDGSGGPGYPSPPECGVDLLDELKCEAKGVKAQAEYNALHALELDTARKSYDTARVQYRKARDDAKKTHKDVGTQLDKVLDQLRCLIDDRTKVGWLDRAFDTVKERLRKCGGESGCGFDDDCDFNELVECPPDDVAGAIKKIEERVAEAKTVFDDLVQEPTELPKRVAALKKEVEDIIKEMATDSRSVDFKALYARALVARYHCENLWRGFHDGNAYVDCLCRTLLCQLRGYDAVSQLTRRQAVYTCRADSETEACKQLRAHTDTAVMEEYEKIKATHHKSHGGGTTGDGYDDSQQGDGTYDDGRPDDYDDSPQGDGTYDDGRPDDYDDSPQGDGTYDDNQQGGGTDDDGQQGGGGSSGYRPQKGGGPAQGGGQHGGGGYAGKTPPPDQGGGQGYERRGRPGPSRPPRG